MLTYVQHSAIEIAKVFSSHLNIPKDNNIQKRINDASTAAAATSGAVTCE